jgi:hypothetical protein
VRIFKTAAVVLIVGLAIGAAWFGNGQPAMAGVKSDEPLYVTNVHVGPPYRSLETRNARREWIGMRMVEVVGRLGRPSHVYRLKDTGGQMLIYIRPFRTHYIFETDPGKALSVTKGRD